MGPLTVNLMSYSFMVLFLPMNFPCVWVTDQYGLRWAVIGGILSTAVGLWVRCLLNQSFAFALIGQTIMALGQPFLYNAPALVTTNWFPERERPVATMVGTQMNILGIFIGFLFPSIFLDPYTDGTVLTPQQRETYERQMFYMMMASAIFATVVAVAVLVSFRERPGAAIFRPRAGAAELIAAEDGAQARVPLLKQMMLCLRNRAYLFTSLGTCGVIMHMYVFTTVIGQLVGPYGITDQTFVTQMGLFVFGFGVLGGVIFSLILMRFPAQMMLAAYIVCVASLACLAFFYVADRQADRGGILAACGVHGFFLLPILFVAYELAVMHTAKDGVGDTMSCGLVNVYANFVGFLIAMALTPALAKETEGGATTTLVVLFANLCVALVFLVVGSAYKPARPARHPSE